MLTSTTCLLAIALQLQLPSIEALIAYAEFALIVLVIALFVVGKIYDAIVSSSFLEKIFPRDWVNYVRTRETERQKRILRPALTELGFDDFVRSQIARKSREISIEKTRLKRDDCVQELDHLIRRYKRRLAQEKSFGTVGKTDIKWPIDFMDAVCNPDELERLAVIMCSFILDEIDKGKMRGGYEFVAGIREGNPYFISNVGRLLGKRVIILKSEHTRRYPEDEFDGTERPADDHAIVLVDDCILSGSLKIETIIRSRFTRNIKHAFVLIEREEGQAREAFKDRGIALHSLKLLSDDDIANMKEENSEIG